MWVCSTFFFREIVDALRNFFLFNPFFSCHPQIVEFLLQQYSKFGLGSNINQVACRNNSFLKIVSLALFQRFETFLDVKVWNDQAANKAILAHPKLYFKKISCYKSFKAQRKQVNIRHFWSKQRKIIVTYSTLWMRKKKLKIISRFFLCLWKFFF